MLATGLCLGAFIATFVATRAALWLGFIATMTAGYFYGIVRANIASPVAQFMYDAATAGLFLGALTITYAPAQRFRLRRLAPWTIALMLWPTMLLLVPAQDPLIQLVGWRGNILFVPFILIGAALEAADLKMIARSLAVLSFVALGFALAEAIFGVRSFYPDNPLDAIIYKSTDVYFGGVSHLRIPATFTHSAVYATSMVAAMPLLLGGLSLEEPHHWQRYLLLGAIGASAAGVFLAASRSEAVILLVMAAAVTFSRPSTRFPWAGWLIVLLAVGWLVAATPRMQRFFTLSSPGVVTSRLHSSVNQSFVELIAEYPLGNGLGGGGTSIPYFLQARLREPVGIENEYARIAAEQGIPGLALWVGFIIWILTRPAPERHDQWCGGKRLARLLCAISFLTAPLGTGLLNSIPQSAMMMAFAGWIAVPVKSSKRTALPKPANAGMGSA
jgi:hypothetical protein